MGLLLLGGIPTLNIINKPIVSHVRWRQALWVKETWRVEKEEWQCQGSSTEQGQMVETGLTEKVAREEMHKGKR